MITMIIGDDINKNEVDDHDGSGCGRGIVSIMVIIILKQYSLCMKVRAITVLMMVILRELNDENLKKKLWKGLWNEEKSNCPCRFRLPDIGDKNQNLLKTCNQKITLSV